MPPWFEVYVGLEEAASVIRCYEAQFVPGLLQCQEYARAVIRLGHPFAADDEIERRVVLRMNRARPLHRAKPPKVWAVIDEAALRRPQGGAAVMRTQIEHLLSLCRLPNVTVQVAAFDHGWPAAAGPFTLLRFASRPCPTSSTSNSSPGRRIWTAARIWTCTRHSSTSCACRRCPLPRPSDSSPGSSRGRRGAAAPPPPPGQVDTNPDSHGARRAAGWGRCRTRHRTRAVQGTHGRFPVSEDRQDRQAAGSTPPRRIRRGC